MLSGTRLAWWTVLLTSVGSVAVAQTEPAAGAAPPAPEKDAKTQEKDGEEAEDLEQTLQEGGVAPVSRLMGHRIVGSAVRPYTHGALMVEWRWQDGPLGHPGTFDLREAHFYLGAHILDIAQPEIFIEFERNNQTSVPIEVRYCQLDLKMFGEIAVVRVGLFLIPFGIYNTELFPRYVAKLPERPLIHRHLVRGSWSEIGMQLLGRWEWSPDRALTYQAYVTNGLVGTVTSTRASYDEAVESLTGSKSFGARVAVEPLDGLSVGLSGYSGTVEAQPGALLLAGLDAIFRRGPFSADGEVVIGERLDPATSARVPERGFYVAAGYKVTNALEPVAAAGGVSISPDPDDTRLNLSAGLNFYPFADRFPSAVLKAAYTRQFVLDGTGANEVQVSAILGY